MDRKMTELERDLSTINELDSNWDFDSIESLIKKYEGTEHEEIKEALYDVVNNWFALLGYDYSCEKVRDNRQSYIEDNLLFFIDLLRRLKPESRLEWEKCYWLKEIASLVPGKTDKEKWLRESYAVVDNALKVYDQDYELLFLKLSVLLEWDVVNRSVERRAEIETLVTSIIDSFDTFPFLEIMKLFVATFWLHEEGDPELCRFYFQQFLKQAEQLFSRQPGLRFDFVNFLAYAHYDEEENAKQNLELIHDNSRLLLDTQRSFDKKYVETAGKLLSLTGRIEDREWRMKMSLLTEELLHLLHEAFPGDPRFISDQVKLLDKRIKDELSGSKNMQVVEDYFADMQELITQSLHIDANYEVSLYADLLKNYNQLLPGKSSPELYNRAIELFKVAIEKDRATSMRLGTEVYFFSSDDRNSLAECYLLQGDVEKAWEVVLEHAAMLEKQKRQYQEYAQFDIKDLLARKEFEPLYEKIRSL
jgi:hypothetical protein